MEKKNNFEHFAETQLSEYLEKIGKSDACGKNIN